MAGPAETVPPGWIGAPFSGSCHPTGASPHGVGPNTSLTACTSLSASA